MDTLIRTIILFTVILFTGCAGSRPSNNPVKETARKTGGSVYKTVEGEGYRWIDKTIIGAVRDVLP